MISLICSCLFRTKTQNLNFNMGTRVTTEFLNLFVNDWFLLSDFADFFVGDLISRGHARSVYQYAHSPGYVIKIDMSGQFNNVSEWDIWHNTKENKDISKFLAPCIRLSSCGRVMLQKKTIPVKLEELPTEVPAFLSDLKLENWGKIGKNVVCHDYANHKFFTYGSELVVADWLHLQKQSIKS